MNELKGHGDPLLVAAMKQMAIQDREKRESEHIPACREVDYGHGDPLFLAAQKPLSPTLKRSASLPLPLALHSEFEGHGDPLMEVILGSWEVVNVSSTTKGDLRLHGEERKKHGDPLLKEFLGTEVHQLKRTASLPRFAEFGGHGDPLMKAFLLSGNFDATIDESKENLNEMAMRGACNDCGAPWLHAFMDGPT